MTDTLQPIQHFPSTIYTIDKPEFLDMARLFSMQLLYEMKNRDEKPNPIYPVQTTMMYEIPELQNMCTFIAQSAWKILDSQGYAMNDKETFFQEMWCQEHQYMHGHEEHTHGDGNQISGFYFIDAPEDGSMVSLLDPRYSRRQVSLPERDLTVITDASETVLYKPAVGRMYFINSWLPHSITRNPSQEPTRLIHFNLGVRKVVKPVSEAVVL